VKNGLSSFGGVPGPYSAIKYSLLLISPLFTGPVHSVAEIEILLGLLAECVLIYVRPTNGLGHLFDVFAFCFVQHD